MIGHVMAGNTKNHVAPLDRLPVKSRISGSCACSWSSLRTLRSWVIALSVLGSSHHVLAADDQARLALPQGDEDQQVRFLSPISGEVFAPGDVVPVAMYVDPAVQPVDVTVSGPGMGCSLEPTEAKLTIWRPTCSFTIENSQAGTEEFHSTLFTASQEAMRGPSVSIIVRPTDVPQALRVNSWYGYQLPQDREALESLAPVGLYADDLRRDLRESVTGTRYVSSRPEVASVDAEGYVRPVGPGIAIVTTEHLGVKAFTIIQVHDQAAQLAPEDVTEAFDIKHGIVQRIEGDEKSANAVQEVRVTNRTALPVPGPLYFVLTQWPDDAMLLEGGKTSVIQPIGSPYVQIPQPSTGLSLLPSESVVLTLPWWRREGAPISYTARVVRADTP